MNVRLRYLDVRTRRTTERIDFSKSVTFLYGPVSTGKSTVARLVDYCLGGSLERTPAIQQEFVAAALSVTLGASQCLLERGTADTQSVRVTWSTPDGEVNSVNAPLEPDAQSLLEHREVYNLSDLVFHLCGVTPIKVRQRSRDPNSPMIRLSVRDLWWYCYLEQTHLDSSFFRLEDPFRGRKSQDAMRFFTGLHSERLSGLETDYITTLDEQRGKREAVVQIRQFMKRFDFGSEFDLVAQLETAQRELVSVEARMKELERTRSAETHPSDPLRVSLRQLGTEIESVRLAIDDSTETIAEQRALRSEFITAKIKAERTNQAVAVLDQVSYERCPECGTDVSSREVETSKCRLCYSPTGSEFAREPLELEALRRDLNERIDQLADSVSRREQEKLRLNRQLKKLQQQKLELDQRLSEELARYDSTVTESIRGAERDRATLVERIRTLRHLQQLPQAIDRHEEEAGELQGKIDRLRTTMLEEKARLRAADANIVAIGTEFKRMMLAVGFPGVSPDDQIVIDSQNWKPTVVHGDQQWSFWDTGSGGKKTLFNVCYALAIHSVALRNEMPVPGVLIIDSPTKNISEDENPDLVNRLYEEIYRLAIDTDGRNVQFVLIDSDLVLPNITVPDFIDRRMAGESDAPRLIPYYEGP